MAYRMVVLKCPRYGGVYLRHANCHVCRAKIIIRVFGTLHPAQALSDSSKIH